MKTAKLISLFLIMMLALAPVSFAQEEAEGDGVGKDNVLISVKRQPILLFIVHPATFFCNML